MVTLYGQSVALGYAAGILTTKCSQNDAIVHLVGELEEELYLFEQVCKYAIQEYEYLVEEARNNFGNVIAMMVWAHQLLIQDPGFHIEIKKVITTKRCLASQAILEVANEIVVPMQKNSDPYLKERANDILYVAEWLSNCYCRIKNKTMDREVILPAEDVILVGDDFGLEDLIVAKRNKVVGFLDKKGSIESHTVMLAKELNTPMILQINVEIEQYIHHSCILNATQGWVQIE